MNELESQPGLVQPPVTTIATPSVPPFQTGTPVQKERPASVASQAIPDAPRPNELLSEMEVARKVEQVGAIVMAARIALRRGQKGAARDKLKEAFAINPTDGGALELLGDIFMEEGEQEKALRVYERGLHFHPQHASFEEKIGLAHIDLDEMQRDRARRDALLEGTDPDKLLDRAPGRAFGISMVVPGAGQIYNGENTRAALFGGGAVFLFFLWFVPLFVGERNNDSPAKVLAAWPGWGVAIFWLVVVGWVGTHLWAAWDAWTGAHRANERRRYGLGIEV